MPPAAVLLDALGTLVQLVPPAPKLRQVLAERFGVTLKERQATQALAAEIAYYRAHLDQGRDAAGLGLLRARCAEVLRSALPASRELDAVSGAELTAALLDSLEFELFGDVLPALGQLRAAGAALVVVSNWDVSLHEVLGRLGLAPRLDAVLTSAECGWRKPAPEIFYRALELVGAPPDRAVHVGDSPVEDVAGARAAGIAPVQIVRAGRLVDAMPGVRTISTLLELVPDGPLPGR